MYESATRKFIRPGNENKLNVRYHNLENLLKASEQSGYYAKVNSLKQIIRKSNMDMALDSFGSLDIMRVIFQTEITREIEQILDRHIRTTFSPAIENLQKHGQVVDEDVIKRLYVSILDAAKIAFIPPPPVPPVVKVERDDVQIIGEKRPHNDSSYIDYSYSEPTRKRKFHQIDPPPPVQPLAQVQLPSPHPHPSPQMYSSPQMNPSPQSHLSPQVATHHTSAADPKSLSQEHLVKWNPDRFTKGMLVVPAHTVASICCTPLATMMNAHQLVFRYSCDENDRRMLSDESRIPPQLERCYLLTLEDAREIVAVLGPGRISELDQHAFRIAETLVVKMRLYAQPIYDRLRQRLTPNSSSWSYPHSH